MQSVTIEFGDQRLPIELLDQVDILTIEAPAPLPDPSGAILRSLQAPTGSEPLGKIARDRLSDNPDATAVIVVSDHTRPVPYRGEQGILWPIIQTLFDAGLSPAKILVLVGGGTHYPMTDTQLKQVLDPRIAEHGIKVRCHDSRDTDGLRSIGRSPRGAEVLLNRRFLDADIRILTGLVESHFIAGVSGGRKAVCPGLVGDQTTHVLHSADFLAAEGARDLNLKDNPLHEEALWVCHQAGVDFIVNVTLDTDYRVTGVFAGDLEQAHQEATAFLMGYATIPVKTDYDVILTHGGFVGINHYQTVKTALAALPALRPGGSLVIGAANTDTDPIGTRRYQSLLHLMKLIGSDQYLKLIFSPDWTFVPDQWEVQAWSYVLERTARLFYYSPQMAEEHYQLIPGVNGNDLLAVEMRYAAKPESTATFFRVALEQILADEPNARVAFLRDGPYGILTRDGAVAKTTRR